MKYIYCLLCCLPGLGCFAQVQAINNFLDQRGINPVTISFHPEGDILISSELNRSDQSQYLLVISKEAGRFQIDTLETSRPNRSVFSKGGEYLVYNYRDPVSGDFFTVKRKYNGVDDIGPPVFISEQLWVDNMYYYYMDEEENLYYYTYVRNNRPAGGLLYSAFENGRYQKPEMIFPDRPNAVAYTPLLLDDQTMIFTQHGVKDNTTDGLYFSRKVEGSWSDPQRLASLPFSNVITYYDEDTVALLLAKTGRVKRYSKEEIWALIP